MAESFLVRQSLSGPLRHIEVHAVEDPESMVDFNYIPLLKVVDVSLHIGSFSKPGVSSDVSGEISDVEAHTVDSILTAHHAAAAVVAFFGEEPVSLAYYVPDEHMHHMPISFVDALPDPLATDIRRVTEKIKEPGLPEYDPRGPYL
jgi:hypothetical protein